MSFIYVDSPFIFAGSLWFGVRLVCSYTIYYTTIVWCGTLSPIQRHWSLWTTFYRTELFVVCNYIYIVYIHYTGIVNYFMQCKGETNSISFCMQVHVVHAQPANTQLKFFVLCWHAKCSTFKFEHSQTSTNNAHGRNVLLLFNCKLSWFLDVLSCLNLGALPATRCTLHIP